MSMDEQPPTLSRTPLHDCHLRLGAKMGEFAGWELPLSYAGILSEVGAVRTEVGVFDVSHLAQVLVSGRDATANLDHLLTNRVADLKTGRSAYSPLCNENGGVVDDLLAYRFGEQEWRCLVNASRAETDLGWMKRHAHGEVSFALQWEAAIAVQGPLARTLASGALADLAALLPRNGFMQVELEGVEVVLACTGYTGEDGFEILAPAAAAAGLWTALTDAGGVPCGLAARDVCRLEAALPLYGHELTEDRSPMECGLAWAVKLNKADFVGKAALQHLAESGNRRRLVGLATPDRAVPRAGYEVVRNGAVVGKVTSGTFSPTLGKGIALAYVEHPAPAVGEQMEIRIRQGLHAATVVPLPFYRSESM
ncbi:MAG: glycine cleavage system protein T [Armatimonadetes bacterium CG_4_10_14_3_um_filter_66_18]|nr:MAG: glycine cleavage system protein T [Armatimonadetes bacterium CG_4_8_14_3_um_filter_66_20]PIY37280.1 MAG: glycine cleavage system protein T [Armatimonadetes bacterium CG_4_10_14_3_um_filter_66_18]PJB63343.1 MAG: glycine cleavage system protein T [Armatimonadetes bacterium CG_4_9_14_3_um_filter_66_14]